MKLKSLIKIYLFIMFYSGIIFSQENPEPCASPEASQFDFWIGEWKAEWENSDGTKGEGLNIINKILGSCVIEENFNGTPGNDLIGKSFSVYNPSKKLWQQTWVDNYGGYMIFTGNFEQDKMILSRRIQNPEDKTILQRMIFYNIRENSFDWNWEKSEDNGINWELSWKIHYSRIR